jgi:hypothetical protein
MSNFEKIRDVITASKLEAEDKAALIAIFAEVTDDLLAGTVKFLEHDPSSVVVLNDNRKRKIQAFSEGNSELWHSILEEERRYIADLTYDLD